MMMAKAMGNEQFDYSWTQKIIKTLIFHETYEHSRQRSKKHSYFIRSMNIFISGDPILQPQLMYF